MVPSLFSLGPLTLYSFGAFLALAFLVGGHITAIGLRERGMDPEISWALLVRAAIGGLIGARLFVVTYDWQGFLADPVGVLLGGSGFIFYGGFLGGAALASIYILRRGLHWPSVADAAAPGLALAHAIGRVGCQISGDGDWGVPTGIPLGMSYPRAVIGWEAWTQSAGLPESVRVHPAPVYESFAYVGVFLLLWSLRGRGFAPGFAFWTYVALAGAARVAVEAVRIEPVVAAGLTQAQWIGIFLILVATPLAIRAVRRSPVEGAS